MTHKIATKKFQKILSLKYIFPFSHQKKNNHRDDNDAIRKEHFDVIVVSLCAFIKLYASSTTTITMKI
jgi:hypothetical protein